MTTENKELDRQNTDESGVEKTEANDPKRDSWPVGVQFIFAVLVLLVVSVLLIGLPILSASIVSNETAGIALTDVVIPMFAVLIALTSMLVSGVFIFMTFRIDRGTRIEARKAAEKAAKKEARATTENYVTSFDNEIFEKIKKLIHHIRVKASDANYSIDKDVARAKSKAVDAVSGIEQSTKDATAQINKHVGDAKSQMSEHIKDVKGEIEQSAKDATAQINKHVGDAKSQMSEHIKDVEGELSQQAEECREGLSKVADTARESIEATAKEISQKLAEFDEFKAITDQLMNSPKLEKRVEELLLTKVNSSLFIKWLESNAETFAKMDRNDVRDLIRALKAATPPRKLPWSKDD